MLFQRARGCFLIYHRNLLSSYIIKRAMPRRVNDEQYDNAKEMKKGHTFISLKKRLKLIQLVFQQKMTIYRAAKRLKICQPTAKFIVKSYKNGRIYQLEPSANHLHQQSPLRLTQNPSSPQIQTIESPVIPTLGIQPQKGEKNTEDTICTATVWANFNNQFFLVPVYFSL